MPMNISVEYFGFIQERDGVPAVIMCIIKVGVGVESPKLLNS